MKHNLLLTLACLCFTLNSFGQAVEVEKEASFRGNTGNLLRLLQKNIRFPQEFRSEEERSITIACAKFIINQKGKVGSVEIYEGTPEPAQNELRRLLTLTNGHWSSRQINGKPVKSIPFVLPIIFIYDGNSHKSSYKQTSEFTSAFVGVFNFLSGEEYKECVIIPPVKVVGYGTQR